MKFVRFGELGRERPGVVDESGELRDMSMLVPDICPSTLSTNLVACVEEAGVSSLPLVSGNPRLGAPVAQVGKFLAIGLNYIEHIAEANQPVPEEPVLFTKATSCIVGAFDPIVLPRNSVKTDWEVELGVVIGRKAQYVDEHDALRYVFGYCVVNDVSEREFQLERGGSWDKGKGCDSFGPIGPYLVSADEVGDPQQLTMWLSVNGVQMQRGCTASMVFPIRRLVSYVSQFMTLQPGDIITTGTPPGVGMGQKPLPVYLREGDHVELGIEGLGAQSQRVVRWSFAAEYDPAK